MENKRKASQGGSGVSEPTPSQRKRPRGGDWEEDGPSQFEEELAFLDEVEAEMALEAKEAQEASDDVPLGEIDRCQIGKGLGMTLQSSKLTAESPVQSVLAKYSWSLCARMVGGSFQSTD